MNQLFRDLSLLGGLALVLSSSACIVEERWSHRHLDAHPVSQCPVVARTAPEMATIDTNSTDVISSPPGEGIGVLVDYDAGGHWHIWSVCDTAVTGLSCGWDVTAQVMSGDPVTNLSGDDLESGDFAGTTHSDTTFFSAETDLGVDGVFFDTAPGAPVEVSASVDGCVFADVISWSNAGDAQTSTTNPVTLTPASP
jgi:hypothetical protein